MTVKEALKQLRYEIEEEGHCSFIEDEMKVAFECMEKQIPKKAIRNNPIVYQKDKDGTNHYAYQYHCPFCDRKIFPCDHHCLCGQTISWGMPKKKPQ